MLLLWRITMSNKKDDIVHSTMLKKVNVIARYHVRTLIPPMYGTYEGIMMSPANILKCLLHKAYVEEILEDGSTLELNMHNYNTVNKPKKTVEHRLESRRMAYTPTMEQLKNKTANLPPSHFLYDIKTENDSKPPVTKEESEKTGKKMEAQESVISTTDPTREFPVAEVVDQKKSTEEESDQK